MTKEYDALMEAGCEYLARFDEDTGPHLGDTVSMGFLAMVREEDQAELLRILRRCLRRGEPMTQGEEERYLGRLWIHAPDDDEERRPRRRRGQRGGAASYDGPRADPEETPYPPFFVLTA